MSAAKRTSFDPSNIPDRYREVLNAVVRRFVLTAQPVSSATVAGRAINYSASTVRNLMSELEAAGLLTHQHTSAGRIPTAIGYRVFVDGIVQPPVDPLAEAELTSAASELTISGELVYERFASVLASASRLITVVLSPRFDRAVLERLELIPVAEERLLIVATLMEGLVKTIIIELPMRVAAGELVGLNRLLNERLSGVRLSQLLSEANLRLADTGLAKSELVRVILNGTEALFGAPTQSVAGTGAALELPEFRDPRRMKTVIELLEGSDILLHLLETDEDGGVGVKIGEETGLAATRELACVSANYRIGDLTGTIGIIGPTRMDYPRQMALIGFAASLLSKMHARKNPQ